MDFEVKKKKFPDFFELEFDKLDELFDGIMKSLEGQDFGKTPGKPLVFGFHMKMDEKGNPVIEQFGNVKQGPEKAMVSDVREPLVDVSEGNDIVTVAAELPGVSRKDLDIKADACFLTISVSGEKKFYKKFKLPQGTIENSANARLNNGVLEITFRKKRDAAKGKIEVK